MPTDRLTDRAIRAEAPRAKPRKVWDGDGLSLLILPTGAKFWRFDYRFAGRRKTLSLGRYPGVTLARARELRREARALLSDGVDPSVARKAEKRRQAQHADRTFAALADEWLARQARIFAPATIDRYRSVLAQMPPSFTSLPVARIEPPQVLAVLRPIEDEGRRSMAHRTKVFVGLVCRYAVANGDATREPTADLRGALLPDQPRHYASITAPAKVGALLRALDGLTAASSVCAALSILPYVFTRPSELRLMRWQDVDLDGALWTVPAAQTKTRRDLLVPLASQVVAKLRALPRAEPAAYVFRSPRTRHRPLSEVTLNAALLRLGYTSAEIVPHGFRAMARTLLDEQLRVDPILIEVQLGHRVPGVLGDTYNRALYLERRREMMQAYGDYLDRLRTTASMPT